LFLQSAVFLNVPTALQPFRRKSRVQDVTPELSTDHSVSDMWATPSHVMRQWQHLPCLRPA